MRERERKCSTINERKRDKVCVREIQEREKEKEIE